MEDYDVRSEVLETLTANSDGGLPEVMSDAELLQGLENLMWASHYPEELVKLAADFRETLPVTVALLKVLGFEMVHTGGGCTAFHKEISGAAYLLITNVEDPSAPTDAELAEGFELGLVIDSRDPQPGDVASMPKGVNLQNVFKVEQQLINLIVSGPTGQKEN